jgi:hypothetical protein
LNIPKVKLKFFVDVLKLIPGAGSFIVKMVRTRKLASVGDKFIRRKRDHKRERMPTVSDAGCVPCAALSTLAVIQFSVSSSEGPVCADVSAAVALAVCGCEAGAVGSSPRLIQASVMTSIKAAKISLFLMN